MSDEYFSKNNAAFGTKAASGNRLSVSVPNVEKHSVCLRHDHGLGHGLADVIRTEDTFGQAYLGLADIMIRHL
ncbi:hypothetical protein Gxy13693_076_007 [Komagataeibacter xylinus NBRC 13693]|uniref:Uncharacterized protein n=1 Tax=Komagataeibacter xylinus NBRC 13693 TaxID=1234668 RepID=A0A0D6QC18_KOMXY|nr:hypothetical protein Gxy13693_076_007 [Komagataeibacter xylinus NBRC 13693]